MSLTHTCIKSSFCCPSSDTGQRSSGSSVATYDYMTDHLIVILTCPGKTSSPLLYTKKKKQCSSGLTLTMKMTISKTRTEKLTLKMTKRSVLVVQQAPQDGRRTHILRPLYLTTSVSGSEIFFVICDFGFFWLTIFVISELHIQVQGLCPRAITFLSYLEKHLFLSYFLQLRHIFWVLIFIYFLLVHLLVCVHFAVFWMFGGSNLFCYKGFHFLWFLF